MELIILLINIILLYKNYHVILLHVNHAIEWLFINLLRRECILQLRDISLRSLKNILQPLLLSGRSRREWNWLIRLLRSLSEHILINLKGRIFHTHLTLISKAEQLISPSWIVLLFHRERRRVVAIGRHILLLLKILLIIVVFELIRRELLTLVLRRVSWEDFIEFLFFERCVLLYVIWRFLVSVVPFWEFALLFELFFCLSSDPEGLLVL